MIGCALNAVVTEVRYFCRCISDYLTPIVTINEFSPEQTKLQEEEPEAKAKKEPDSDDERVRPGDVDIDTSELRYICHVCKSDTKMDEKELRLHFKLEHQGKRLRTMKVSKEDAIPCYVCPKQFRTVKRLKEHMEVHSNEFNCEICNVSFKKCLDYTIHMRGHSSDGQFCCVLCEFQTDCINTITDHAKRQHHRDYRFKCEKCGQGFHVLSWYLEHDNFHTGARPFECTFCRKSFPYSRYLTVHESTMHREEVAGNPQVHQCVLCKKQYQHRNSLKLHMNLHTGNVAICEICGKTLSSNEKLKFHMRTHTGYKPFGCKYCEKSFTKKPILVEHERIHTGERPYVCEFCFRGFTQRSSLVIHIRSHTGERPYVCHLCNKGFVARAMLNMHFRTCKGFS